MASIRDYLSAGASNFIGFVRSILGLPLKVAKLGWTGLKWLTKSLWWWSLLSVRFFGRHYVWLFLLLFFVWMWWQGGHLLITMSELITIYSQELIQDGGAGQDYEGIRNLLLGLAALMSVPFFFLRTWINERQTRTQEQGHMTDRIAKAVEALGSEKEVKKVYGETDTDGGQKTVEVTLPNLEVRIGAIYALERISQDSARDHWQVMEILTAYLRENARGWPNGPPPLPKHGTLARRSGKGNWHDLVKWLQLQDAIRIDFQAIVSVLAKRSTVRRFEEKRRGQNLDLRGVHLFRPDFRAPNVNSDFSRANFTRGTSLGPHLRGDDLSRVSLIGAVFGNVNLSGANLEGVILIAAELTGANLEGAKLKGASLSGANLAKVNLVRADLAGILGLRHVKNLDQARLPDGWSAKLNEQDNTWDIMTPDGPYVDPLEREEDT